MANNTHGYVSTMRCACTNVDSFNRVGIYSTGDLDNGVLVTLGDITKATDGTVTAFNYAVTPATVDTTGSVWLVDTPEVGTNIEMQMMSDPRYFYNEKGRPMSLKYLNPKTDIIEADAGCFVGGTLPTTSQKSERPCCKNNLGKPHSNQYCQRQKLRFPDLAYYQISFTIFNFT